MDLESALRLWSKLLKDSHMLWQRQCHSNDIESSAAFQDQAHWHPSSFHQGQISKGKSEVVLHSIHWSISWHYHKDIGRKDFKQIDCRSWHSFNDLIVFKLFNITFACFLKNTKTHKKCYFYYIYRFLHSFLKLCF